MANPFRLSILVHLVKGEKPAAWLESELRFQQPNLSERLRALRDAKLVQTRKEAKFVFYRLANGPSNRAVGVILSRILNGDGAFLREGPAPSRPLRQQAAQLAKSQ